MDTNQFITPIFTLLGTFVGGVIVYLNDRQKQAQEERTRKVNEVRSIYSHVAFTLLKRYKSAETENLDDGIIQSLVDIMLCDDKPDPIIKSMIVLTDESTWNDKQKYNLARNKILHEMRARLEEIKNGKEIKKKGWWQFWK